MNRFTPSVPLILVLGVLSAATAAADEASPATATAQAASAAASQPAATMPAHVNPNSTASRSDPTVRKLVCLNMSLQCFAMKDQSPDGATKTKSLDLRAPDIRSVVSEVELREPLGEPEDASYEQEQVQVQGSRPEIDVPIGLASLGWAAMHPLQSWRIFLPVSSAK